MKTLTILQPWASLVVKGEKKIETRSWRSHYRGELLIHSSAKLTIANIQTGRSFNFQFCCGLGFIGDLPTSSIIGKVKLVDVVPVSDLWESLSKKERSFGDYTSGRYGWLFEDFEEFQAPIKTKGRLGIWDYYPGAGKRC